MDLIGWLVEGFDIDINHAVVVHMPRQAHERAISRHLTPIRNECARKRCAKGNLQFVRCHCALCDPNEFDPADRSHVRIDTNKMPYLRPAERPEIEMMPLFRDAGEDVRLERWPAATRIELALPGGGEFFVLDGGFTESGETFEKDSWLRLPSGARLQAQSGPNGCRLWVKTGHLAEVRGWTATKDL